MKALHLALCRDFFAPVRLSRCRIELPERVAHHCAVLRLRRGDAVTLFNGEGGSLPPS